MKFYELKKFLQNNTLNNYLLQGNDAFLLNRAYELIYESKDFTPKDLNVITFSENCDANNIVKALNTLPFMTDFKLVYVNVAAETDTILNATELNDYLKNFNPSSILVINAGANKTVIGKFNNIEIIDCNRLPDGMINAYVKSQLNKHNKTISPGALKKLCELCLYNLANINTELLKLVNYNFNNSEISEEDVLKIVNKTLNAQIFDLTESLAKKDADKVYEIFNEIKSKKENEKSILPTIGSHFRRLLNVKLNVGNKQLPKLLNVKEYAVTIAMAQSKLFNAKTLKFITDLWLELDFAVKKGDMSLDGALNYLILQILNY